MRRQPSALRRSDYVGWLSVLLLCMVQVYELRAEPIRVYIMAGQSNMVGGGLTSELPTSPFDYQAPQTVLYHYGLSKEPNVGSSTTWELLRPSVHGGSFGAEITFGQRMHEVYDRVAIIKQAASGTSLDEDWNPDATDGLMMFDRMIDRVSNALTALDNQGQAYVLSGILWMQGESDAGGVRAQQYQQRLTEFIAATRTALGAPELPFVIGRISSGTTFSGLTTIRQAQANVAKADPHTLAADLDHLPLKYDLVHFTSAGHMGLGEAFADAILFGAPSEDMDGDGLVSDNDLNIAVSHWNQPAPADAQGFGDADGDGFVGMTDLALIVNRIPAPAPPLAPGDATGDSYVGIDDLNLILTYWNQNVPPGRLDQGEMSGDGFVGVADLTQVLGNWNRSVTDTRPPPPTAADMDLDHNGALGLGDLGRLFADWSFVDETAPDVEDGSSAANVTGDFNADGVIDVEDLRYLLLAMPDGPQLGSEDLDGDGFIGVGDLNIILTNWNQNVTPGDRLAGDASGDGFVGVTDLNRVLGAWNQGSPPSVQAAPEPDTCLVFAAMAAWRVGRRRAAT